MVISVSVFLRISNSLKIKMAIYMLFYLLKVTRKGLAVQYKKAFLSGWENRYLIFSGWENKYFCNVSQQVLSEVVVQ